MPDALIIVHPGRPIGQISPRLYGHFAEHIGRCCYDGLFVGASCEGIRHQEGFRLDVLEALREMPTPLLRWPGGCYADHYHWRDGIGPLKDRPQRLGLSCGFTVEDDNGLGTHEFLRLCELIGAEPYLAGNVGSGAPQELCDWLEYCNAEISTSLTRERARNGRQAAWHVKLWGVGNENWGCGGCFDAESYAVEYKRFACMLRHVDSKAELVACGFEMEWNRKLLQALRGHKDLIDHISIHRYWSGGGPGADFSEEQYHALIRDAEDTEAFVAETAELLRDEFGHDTRVGIALDEWGAWHPEARAWGEGGGEKHPDNFEQPGTLRDGLAAALALEGFHRQCKALSLANLAQVVNVLHAPIRTDGARMWRTPTYHVLNLHRPHIGATALQTEAGGGATRTDGRPAVSATASVDGERMAVTLVNSHFRQGATVRLRGLPASSTLSGRILTASRPSAMNTAEEPDRVKPEPITAITDGADWVVDLPPHSVATLST